MYPQQQKYTYQLPVMKIFEKANSTKGFFNNILVKFV